MDLVPLADVELRYTALESVDYGAGGQLYDTMEGSLSGDQLRGSMHLTNLAPRRPDNVNMSTLRGLLITDEGATLYVEMAGIATLRTADQARVFVTSLTFRTGDARYHWINRVFGVLEGILDSISVGGIARGRAYCCDPTLGALEPRFGA
jgi:hypothetical protein